MNKDTLSILDPLYGSVTLPPAIAELAWSVAIQRLRHIRLSNIDSLEMPGISNISRYEHALGVAYLATRPQLLKSLTTRQVTMLQAAALMHDFGIAPFGHLVEEAFEFTSAEMDHQERLSKLKGQKGIFDLDRQMLYGRPSKFREWIKKTFGGDEDHCLDEIGKIIKGEGDLGKIISGAMDLDNLDNVVRIGFHMGLNVDRRLPIKVAEEMKAFKNGDVVYSDDALPLIEEWLKLRQIVYSKLMPSKLDFIGKAMMIWTTIWAIEKEELKDMDWIETDISITNKYLESSDNQIRNTTQRWLSGDLWEVSELFWFDGNIPHFRGLKSFCDVLSKHLGKECYCYRIKDKRNRMINIQVGRGGSVLLGENSTKWLLGVCTPSKPFSNKENKMIIEAVAKHFETRYLATAEDVNAPTGSIFSF